MDEIIKLVFPDLRYGGDPDIERYFELRKAGSLGQALSIYNRTLRVRYPDDGARVVLLKLYRENDPRYAAYQENLIRDFSARVSVRIRANIDLLVAPLEKADLSDALRALKAVESVLSRVPGDSEGALDLLSRYDKFARVLGHREVLVRRALDLVREYDAVSRADAPSEYDFVARSAAIEERRQALSRSQALSRRSASTAGSGAAGKAEEPYDFVSRSASLERDRKGAKVKERSYFDPDRIKFTEAEKARVEISPALSRREDRVLAFCAKYWSRAGDAAFERVVFLYSRKYGGRNFEVFRAIKLGRARGATDDEILSAVAAILTTSYNYSVSGDLYMQVMWRRLRARMEERATEERLAAPGPEATTRANPAPPPESRVRARRAAYSAGDESIRALEEAKEEGAILPPPAGDEPATRFARGVIGDRFAAPPEFALREAAQRAASGSGAGARPVPKGDEGLGLRAASRAAAAPASRAPAPPIEPPASPAAPRRAAPVPKRPSPRGAAKIGAASPRAGAPGRATPVPEPAPGSSQFRPVSKAAGAKRLNRSPVGPEPVREIRAKRGSISDSIRKLSGRTYDVYREIFLDKVRGHIHRALLASRTKSHGIFDTAANDAEDQIYGFITAHYDDPFMDWEHSAEREIVEGLGFSMPSLLPIIESCFKKLG